MVAPFAIWLVFGLSRARAPELELVGGLDRSQVAEGDRLAWAGALTCRGRAGAIDLTLAHAPDLSCDVPGHRLRLTLRTDAEEALSWPLLARRWGNHLVGPVSVRTEDPLGLIRYSGRLGEPARVKVYPSWDRLRRLVDPARTQLYSGNRIARQHGEGIEFAEIRAFSPGDLVRRLNWRVTARTGVPFVNDFHLERNADVILFIDSFIELGEGLESVLTAAVRAAAALADGYLGERDRVGVVGFGGVLRWMLPGMGVRQFYRVVEALLDTQVVTSYAWQQMDVIPTRVLPPSATVLALSPLLDLRSLGALVNLYHRGFDLVVLEIDPERFVRARGAKVDDSALSLWQLLREARRGELQRAGLIVLPWPEGTSLESVLTEVREYRRFARRSAA